MERHISWLAGRCCQAYHDGFVVPLARDPKAVLLALVGDGKEEPSDDAALAAARQPSTGP